MTGGSDTTEFAATVRLAPRRQLEPSSLAPGAATRLAYAYGVQTGDIVWVAGQVARDRDGTLVGAGDAEAQAGQCFANVQAIVEAAGGTMADVVRANMYVTAREHRDAVNAVRGRYFRTPHLPTGALLVVAGLALPEYLVEVDAVAVLGSSGAVPPPGDRSGGGR